MEEKIYRVQAKSQAGNIWIKDMTTQNGQIQRKISKGSYAFCQKFQKRASGQGKSTAGVTFYLWEYIKNIAASSPLKLPQSYLLSGFWKGEVGAFLSHS